MSDDILFTPVRAGAIELANRIVMAPSDPVATFSAAVQALSALGIAYVHVVEPSDADRRHGGPGWKSASARELRRHLRGTYIAALEMTKTKEKAAARIREGLADAAAFA